MACLDEQTVLALVERALPEVARRTAEQHLDTCQSCLELVAELARTTTGAPPRAKAAVAFGDGDRYELGPELARGGMGRIHEAFDRRLGRHVAIKCALDRAPELTQRFAREIALTSRLEHPAIVPIHDAGTLADGTPYYAMRLVAGRTLDRLIAEADTPAKRLALVPNVIAVADAIAYAHNHHIIHRDLKPHNVLVGEFGETVLLDWGLAKDLAASERDTALPTTSSDVAMTEGRVLGTRGYMPPEQAAGGSVGLSADVYALGATLHHVLTGALPRTPLPPLDDSAGAPSDLVAIVARATAEKPDDRYASARELAADLRRFQAGRLVQAHRYSAWQLVGRWVARHRAAVAVGGVAVVLIAVLSAVGLRRIFAERAAAVSARDRAELQRDAAEQVVGFVVGDLRTRLERLGRLDLLAGAGDRVVAYYGRVGHDRASALGHHLDALQVLGEAQQAASDHVAALATYREELVLARQHGAPDRICWALVRLGQTLRATGKADEAAAPIQECAEIASRSADRTTERWQRLLAATEVELAKIAYGKLDLAEARRHAEAAGVQGRALVERGIDWGNIVIGKTSGYLAQWALEEGDTTAAKRHAFDCVSAARVLADRQPDDVDSHHMLASSLAVLGQAQQGDDASAQRSYDEAREVLTRLVAREPNSAVFRRELSRIETLLGRLAAARNDLPAALRHFEASRTLSAAIGAASPNSPDAARDLAVTESEFADLYVQTGNRSAARDAYRRSIDGFERVFALTPKELSASSELGLALEDFADFELAGGDRTSARTALDRSIELGRTVLAASDSPATRMALAHRLVMRAKADPANAARSLQEAAALVEPVRAKLAEDPELKPQLAELDALARKPR